MLFCDLYSCTLQGVWPQWPLEEWLSWEEVWQVNKQFIDQSNKHFPPAAAFKFSPSLNGESSGMSKVEKERRLEELKKVRDSLSLSLNQFAVNNT